jgi:DNA-binding GntR family transcriptional regulator
MTRSSRPIERAPRQTLAAVVTAQLRDRILDGTLPPGMQLNEMDLAEQFAVSRGPVREGLQRLIQEGLLRSEPHRGVFVPVVDAEDLGDIYFAREAMENAAMRRLMLSGRAKAIVTDLDQIVDQMAEAATADDWPQVAELDMRFHSRIVAAADSPRLSRMFDTLIAETRLCLSMLTVVYPGREDLVGEHRELSQLLAGTDLDLLLATLSTHFSDALRSLRDRQAQQAAAAAAAPAIPNRQSRERNPRTTTQPGR